MLNDSIITIVLMGCATFFVRAAGYWLASRIKLNPVFENWLKYLPGCIIISIVAPLVIQGGIKQWIGALVTIIIMVKTDNILLAMVLGLATVVVIRAVI